MIRCPVTGELVECEECDPECYEMLIEEEMERERAIAEASMYEEAMAEMEMAMMEEMEAEEYYEEPPPDW